VTDWRGSKSDVSDKFCAYLKHGIKFYGKISDLNQAISQEQADIHSFPQPYLKSVLLK
jgi:hypothetical protein